MTCHLNGCNAPWQLNVAHCEVSLVGRVMTRQHWIHIRWHAYAAGLRVCILPEPPVLGPSRHRGQLTLAGVSSCATLIAKGGTKQLLAEHGRLSFL